MAIELTQREELESIKLALLAFPEGALVDEVAQVLTFTLPKRTLQRRLQRLQEKGFIRIEGKSRATKYSLIEPSAQTNVTAATEDAIPLSAQAQKTLSLVKAPIHQRKPVGYNREFVESYQPNVTQYLAQDEIEKLTALGKTTMVEHPAGTYAKEILNRLLIDLSWNSSRLEGNTYSLLDTQRLIDSGQALDNKTTLESQMILNHKEAIEFLVYSAQDIGFNRYTILNLHGLLSYNLLPDPSASGRLRHIAVGISHSVFEPLAVPQEITEVFDLILEKAEQITNPFEQAFFVMVHFPYLQPFDDVNKRVSRLASNISFTKHNLSPLSFVDVPNDLYTWGIIGVYELNRIDLLKSVFMWAYERSSHRYSAVRQSLGEPDPFRIQYRETMRELIAHIVTKTMDHAQASEQVQTKALSLPTTDRARFVEVVETELLSLHEGNFARYRIRPSAFDAWQKIWG